MTQNEQRAINSMIRALAGMDLTEDDYTIEGGENEGAYYIAICCGTVDAGRIAAAAKARACDDAVERIDTVGGAWITYRAF